MISNKSFVWKFHILGLDDGKTHAIGRSFVILEHVGRVWRTLNDKQEAKHVQEHLGFYMLLLLHAENWPLPSFDTCYWMADEWI